MKRKLPLLAVLLLLLQVFFPLSNVFAAEIIIGAPANLKANQYYPGNIFLEWDKVTGAGNYRIYKIQDEEKEFIKEVSYKDTSTTVFNVPEGSSTFAVSAVRLGSESELSNTVTVEIVYPVMESPLNIVSNVANGNDLTISWDKVTYATDYNIYQVVDGVRTTEAITKTNSYTFENHPEGIYSYEVTAYNSRFGESLEGAKIEGEVIFPEIQAPIVTYKIQDGNDLVFNWQRVTYATNYRIYEVVDGDRNLLTTTRLNSHLISNVSEENHIYEITTYSDRFGESEVPFRIEFDMVFPEMQAPESLTYTLSNYNDINLRWTQAQYADKYKLYQVIDGEKKLISSTSALNTTFKNMPEGHYTYEVASYSERFGDSEQVTSLEFDLFHPDMLAPENPTITVQNGSDLVLRWDAFEYATAYRVYQIIDGERRLITTRTGNAHTMLNMPEGQYTFEITSFSDRFGESPNSTRIDYELKFPELQAPELTGKVENENQIFLDWTKEDFAAGYNIYQIIDGSKKFVGTTTSLQFKLTNLSEGYYTYEATSYHSRFGESASSNQIKLYIGPKLEAPKNAGSVVEDDAVTLNWDPVQNAESYNIYEVVNGEPKLVENTKDTSLTIGDVEPGNYEYRVVPVSPSGVESEEYSTIEIQQDEFDTTPPVTTSNLTELSLREAFEVQLTATDTQSGVDKTFYAINGSEFTEGTSFLLAEEGIHTVSFYSIDKAGNEEEVQTLEVELELDKTAPVTTSNVTDDWYKEDVIVQLTATDDLSGVNKTFYSINGIEFTEGTSFTLTEEGTYKISFYSVDNSENVEEAKTIEVKIDKTAPVTASDAPINWSLEDATVQLTATDNLSGVDKTYYSINGSEFVEGTTFTVPEQGINKVSYYSVDKAGNVEEIKTIEVKVDKTAPTTISNATNDWSKAEVAIELTATDAESGVDHTYYSINGSDFVEGTSFLVSEEGINKVSFYSVDRAGNVEEIKTVEVKVDKTAPMTTSNATNDWSKEEVAIELTATDDLSGVDKTYYSVNGSDFVEGTSFLVSEEGINKISYYSVDKAGNVEETKIVEVKVDKTAPMTTSNATNDWSKEEVAIELTATDNLSGVDKIYYSINGSDFVEGTSFLVSEEGINKVSYYSVDKAGNVEEVKNVEVKVDKSAPEVNWNLADEYALGSSLDLNYTATDAVSGVVNEVLTVNGETYTNGDKVTLDQPGTYEAIVTVTDKAGWTTTLEKTFVVYIPTTIKVNPGVIKGNKGVFTVQVTTPKGFDEAKFDLSTAKVNRVSANTGTKGLLQQAKKGQFKFERENFTWNPGTVEIEFRALLDGYLVVGSTTVKVK